MTRIAIVGLGLVGTSIALGLREARASWRLIGVDDAPIAPGVVDERFAVVDLARALDGVDLALLCAPVCAIADQVELAVEHASVVTDCGSTKRAIVARADRSPRRARFVPGHPMAGGPEAGARRARPDLFRGKRWILCPEGAHREAVERVQDVVRLLGAEPVAMTADAHDAAVALTSHVPQLLACALLAQAAQAGALVARGPAFDAATGAASGNPVMWRDVLTTNADAVDAALATLTATLASIRAGLGERPPDPEPALSVMARARRVRRT